jgi:GxxExxY protein
MNENQLSYLVIGAAIDVHAELGPGLLEKVYKECLAYRLRELNLKVEQEKPMPVQFKDIQISCGYFADLVVEDILLIELKSVEMIHPVHVAQTLTYLKLSGIKLALLMNFNVKYLKNGIKRLVMDL